MPYPRAFSHVGLSVTDIEEAVEFYTEVFGCYLIVEPASFDEEEDADRPVGQMLTDALGAGWERVKIAHLATSDGVGIELFEFEGAERSEDPLEYRQTGIFHFCVQDPDIEGLARKIEEHGGKQTMPVRAYHPGEKPFKDGLLRGSLWKRHRDLHAQLRDDLFRRSLRARGGRVSRLQTPFTALANC